MKTSAPLTWDMPTRIFHWTLATCFGGAWAMPGSERWIEVHASARLAALRRVHHEGHNPAGGRVVVATLAQGAVTAAAGYLTLKD